MLLLGVGSAAAAFSPLNIPGLERWHAAKKETAYGDGDSVATITDFSASGEDITQATSDKQPTFQTNEFNGKPVFRADGTDDIMDIPDLSALTAATVFIVMRQVVDASDGGYAHLGSSGQATHYAFSDGKIYDALGSTVRRDTGNPTVDLTTIHIYSVVTSSSEWTSRINGASHFTTATNTVGFRADPVLFAGSVAPSFFDAVDIAEIIIYDSALGASDLSAVHEYLGAEYGVTV